jgi:hypothetical protein
MKLKTTTAIWALCLRTLTLAPMALAQSPAASTTGQMARAEDGFFRKAVARSDRITANAYAGGAEILYTL